MSPKVSVIVPTRDRPHDIARMLDALMRNDHLDKIELILIDDGSRTTLVPDTSSVGFPIKILRNALPKGPTVSRNRGVAVADGEIVAFLDDDAIPVPDWMDVIITAFEGGSNAVTGPILRFDSGLLSRARQARYNARYDRLSDGDVVGFFAGGNSAISKSMFERIGGFTSREVGGDNAVVADLAQIGSTVTFLRRMKILHRNSKGAYAAIFNAYASGLARASQVNVGSAIWDWCKGRSAVGERIDEMALNMALGALHITGLMCGRVLHRNTDPAHDPERTKT